MRVGADPKVMGSRRSRRNARIEDEKEEYNWILRSWLDPASHLNMIFSVRMTLAMTIQLILIWGITPLILHTNCSDQSGINDHWKNVINLTAFWCLVSSLMYVWIYYSHTKTYWFKHSSLYLIHWNTLVYISVSVKS